MDEKLGGLLRDIVELFTDIPELSMGLAPEDFRARVEILRDRVQEAYPA